MRDMSWDEMISHLEQLFRNAGGSRKVKFIRMGTAAYRQFCKTMTERSQKRISSVKLTRPICPHFRGVKIYIDDRLDAEEIEMCGEEHGEDARG